MKWTLLVTGHGRWGYLDRMTESVNFDLFDRRILSLDGGAGEVTSGDWTEIHRLPSRMGLSANLAQGWAAVTRGEGSMVLHVEEDFIIGDVDLDAMAATLNANPDVAQMALVRQPWSPEEHAAGGMLYGPHLEGDLVEECGWLRHNRIYTLNPHVVRSDLLAELTAGVEHDLTAQCQDRGLSFGFFGAINDPPRCLHVGHEGGMGSQGWMP